MATYQRWFKSENPEKELTHSQISKILNAKRPRVPSDVDPGQIQRLHSGLGLGNSMNWTMDYTNGSSQCRKIVK